MFGRGPLQSSLATIPIITRNGDIKIARIGRDRVDFLSQQGGFGSAESLFKFFQKLLHKPFAYGEGPDSSWC